MTTRASRLVRRTCLPFDLLPCAPDSPASDLLGMAPGGSSLFKGTPLERDRLSRLIVGRYDPCLGPVQTFSFRGFPGPYTATVSAPEGCYSPQESNEIRMTILRLNTFAKVPVTTFRRSKVSFLTHKRDAQYDWQDHTVHLSHTSSRGPHVPLIRETKAEIVHEMGHAIYRKGFWKDPDWQAVYDRSLAHQNYEILHDANYLQDAANDAIGHPWDDADEAFGSAVLAYFLNADQLVAYIRNEKTPESMRTFGKLVWTYMRDRVFRGCVFTSDDVDPFAGEQFRPLLERLPGKKESLLSLFQDPDVGVRRSIAFNINFFGGKDAANEIPALIVAVQDTDPAVRRSAMWALMGYGPEAKAAVPVLVKCLLHKEAQMRLYAAYALDNIGRNARAASPALQAARRDADPDVAEAARKALKEILAP